MKLPGRCDRLSLLCVAACAAVGLVAQGNACASSPPLFRTLAAETGTPVVVPRMSRLRRGSTVVDPFPASGFAYVAYARSTRLAFFGRQGPFRAEIGIWESEDLLGVMDTLQPGQKHRATARYPDLQPIHIRIENATTEPQEVNLELVEVARVGGSAIRCMTAEQYVEGFYSPSMFPLSYEWAFAQRDEHRFWHPIPDYVVESREARSGSVQEHREARRAALDDAARRHQGSTKIAPLGSVEGVCLFPLLLPGRHELRYVSDTPGQRAPFPPLRFVVRIGTDHEGARPDVGRPESPETEDQDDYMERHERAMAERRQFLRRELYTMHKQFREHDRLRRQKAKSKTKAKQVGPSRSVKKPGLQKSGATKGSSP